MDFTQTLSTNKQTKPVDCKFFLTIIRCSFHISGTNKKMLRSITLKEKKEGKKGKESQLEGE